MESIHDGPRTKCPDNITWRFLQSKGATAWDLHQPGGGTDVCIEMDYPFLQPRHLEKEFRGNSLHLYTSVFGNGLFLCKVERSLAVGPMVNIAAAKNVVEEMELPGDKT